MQTKHLALTIAAVSFVLPTTHVRGDTMISNLDVPWVDIQAVSPQQGFGFSFRTGSTPFELDSITLEHLLFSEPLSSFQVQIYLLGEPQFFFGFYPVTWVGDLGNPVVDPRPTQSPELTRYVTYTPTNTISLETNTKYLVTVTDWVQNQTGLLFAPASSYSVAGDWQVQSPIHFISNGEGWTLKQPPFLDLKLEINASSSGQDTTPPTITCPADITVPATNATGATVNFSVTASDNSDPNPTLSSSPASGSAFPIGTTTVNSAATDSSGNTASCSFTVTVKGAPEQITDLMVLVESFNLEPGTENSLLVKLRTASESLGRADVSATCDNLNAFIHEVSAQAGKKITPAQSDLLIQEATRIRVVLGC